MHSALMTTSYFYMLSQPTIPPEVKWCNMSKMEKRMINYHRNSMQTWRFFNVNLLTSAIVSYVFNSFLLFRKPPYNSYTSRPSSEKKTQIEPRGPTPAIDTWHAWQFRSKNRQPDFVFFLCPGHVWIAGVGAPGWFCRPGLIELFYENTRPHNLHQRRKHPSPQTRGRPIDENEFQKSSM